MMQLVYAVEEKVSPYICMQLNIIKVMTKDIQTILYPHLPLVGQ